MVTARILLPDRAKGLTRSISMSPLAARIPGESIGPVIEKITNLIDGNSADASVPNTALRSVISSLPHPQPMTPISSAVKIAYSAISKVLVPRLTSQHVISPDRASLQSTRGPAPSPPHQEYNADTIDLMVEVIKCYGIMLHDWELAALSKTLMSVIESSQANNVVKKRALAGLGACMPHFSDDRFSQFVAVLVQSLENPQLLPVNRRYLIATIGVLARASPLRFGPLLRTLAPFVLNTVNRGEPTEITGASETDHEPDAQEEELLETALVTLEALLNLCGTDLQQSMPEVVGASIRYLKFDPNVAEAEDDDVGAPEDGGSDDDGTQEPEDDEDGEFADLDDDADAFSDVDDLSWRVRRSAAKLLDTIIAAGSLLEGKLLYDEVAPALILRLRQEREESVKFEIMSAAIALLRRTGQEATAASNLRDGSSEAPIPLLNTRKRRRLDSNVSADSLDMNAFQQPQSSPVVLPSSPSTEPQASLAALLPKLVSALVKLWKKASMALRQSCVQTLRCLTLTRNGAIADFLQQVEDLITDGLKPSSSALSSTGSHTTTGANLQIETLSLVSVITETTPTDALLPFIISLIPAVTMTVREHSFKVSSEALAALEQFVKALTPPRLPPTDQDLAMQLEKVYEITADRVADNNADLEVRHRAIQVIGVLLARTAATNMLKPETRSRGFDLLKERLMNETTRIWSARAISRSAAVVTAQNDISPEWMRKVSVELGSHLRKADRVLREACLDALKNLALNSVLAAHINDSTLQDLTSCLLPLLIATDITLLTPTLIVFARFVPINPVHVVQEPLVKAIGSVCLSPLAGPSLKALLLLVKVIGEHEQGTRLMRHLLDVGVRGELPVLGRCLGTLVFYGGPNVGAGVEDFKNEVQSQHDENRQCLALTVLGEISLRMGSSSPVKAAIFEEAMMAESDKVRTAAAAALGSAASSNSREYMPLFTQSLGAGDAKADSLLLHALKELFQHPGNLTQNLSPYAKDLWTRLFLACRHEDNLAVGAECIGRLVMIDPSAYVPELHQYLQDPNPASRGTVITALRFTLTGSGEAYNNKSVRNDMVSLLMAMLKDQEISNRKLAIATLNSAIHNRPELVGPELGHILPIVLADTWIKPELLRQVSFGPFKITVDDGLDVRKAAYEALYGLLETLSVSTLLRYISIPTLYERILDGVADDHDIRTLCNLMVVKLAAVDPHETRRRLPALSEKFRLVLVQRPKENAVKQEIEKSAEAHTGVIRTSMMLDKRFPVAGTGGGGGGDIMGGGMIVWKGYLDWMKKEFPAVVRSIQQEATI